MNNSISIIIPTYHEEKNIETTLQCLFDAIDYSNLNVEVIIVDSSTNALTQQAINEFTIKIGRHCKIIACQNKTFAGKARNLGVKQSMYSLIAFVDAGVYVEKEWLVGLHQQIILHDADIVWGRSDHRVSSVWQRCYIRSFYRSNYTPRYIRSCMIKKEVFNQLGGFLEHVHAGEDLDFYQRVKQSSYHERFVDVQAWYSHFPESLSQMLKKWISFTSDNVLAKQVKAKLIFVSLQLIVVVAIVVLWINQRWEGWLLLILAIVLRFLMQWYAAKVRMQSWIEIPLTLLCIVVFDTARWLGLAQGFLRLLTIKTNNLFMK